MILIPLALAAAILMGAASLAGIFLPFVYARETASWAAQGIGQDAVNVTVILPALLACLRRAAHGSLRAVLVAAGLLIYIVYSYVLYAFFVHFNAISPVYIAVLGTSFYALVASLWTVRGEEVQELFDGRSGRAQSVYLMVSGALFGMLWLSSIGRAIVSGDTPREIVDAGLPVNPIHVLDLAFVLPAMIVTAVLLRRRHPLGLLFAIPLLSFAAAMGAAIIGMMLVMKIRGLEAPVPLIGAMALSSSLAVYLIADILLPEIRHPRLIPE